MCYFRLCDVLYVIIIISRPPAVERWLTKYAVGYVSLFVRLRAISFCKQDISKIFDLFLHNL